MLKTSRVPSDCGDLTGEKQAEGGDGDTDERNVSRMIRENLVVTRDQDERDRNRIDFKQLINSIKSEISQIDGGSSQMHQQSRNR